MWKLVTLAVVLSADCRNVAHEHYWPCTRFTQVAASGGPVWRYILSDWQKFAI